MRTVPLRTAGHHSAAAADAASSRCAGAATAMPLPGSPLRSAVASAARMPAASEGASTTRPPSSGSGNPPTLRSMTRASSLSTTRVAPQWPVTRTRSPSKPGSSRMRSSTANAAQPRPNTASGSTSSSGSTPLSSGIGTASIGGGSPAGGPRLATGKPTVVAGRPPFPAPGAPERYNTTGPGNTSLPVRSRHPAPAAASERAIRSARTTPPPTSTSATNRPSACTTSP